MKQSPAFALALSVLALSAFSAQSQEFDIVISNGRVMDPETLYDGVANVGIKAVIVNGTVTVRDDELLKVFAGQPIRFEPEAKPRFEPVSEEAWNLEFSTGMPDVAPGIPPKGGN